MEAETDGSLLYYMSCRDSAADRVVSDTAAIEFHRRHMAHLYGRCRRICGRMVVADSFAEDLASATLVKAAGAAHTFVDGEEPNARASRTRAWLGKIAWHLLVDMQRNPNRPGPLTGPQEEIPFDDYSTEDFAALYCNGDRMPRDVETIRLVVEAISTLEERTRRVLMHTVLQRQRSPGRSYVYRGSADALAKRIGTTRVNIRRIFGVGVRAIAAYVGHHRRGR
jgi:DNA-directed RNA polymerase specialized sigma24 family protein